MSTSGYRSDCAMRLQFSRASWINVQRRAVWFCDHLSWWFLHIQSEPQNLEEHLKHLNIFTGRLASAGLKLKPSKCKLIQRVVSHLGYHIGADGIRPDEGKLHALLKWLGPTNTTEVRSFVGFCSYYRRFVKNIAGIANTLHELTKKHQPFYWNENFQRFFEDLKNKLNGAPILSHPNYDRPFALETDASNNSISVIL